MSYAEQMATRVLGFCATAVVLGVLVGCGSASRASASSRTYSVQEVRAAFAAEGMPLHRVRLGNMGFKWLSYGRQRGKRFLVVWVFPDAASTHGGKTFAHGSPRPRTVRDRNVLLQFPPSLYGKVRAGLARLR
jgi:hypothetical protein